MNKEILSSHHSGKAKFTLLLETVNCLKKQFVNAMILAILVSNCNMLRAQQNLWSLGDQQLNFDGVSQIEVAELPTPLPLIGYPAHYVYTGFIPQYHQHIQFNEVGELLFFIVDGLIYNNEGYLIADSYYTSQDSYWPKLGRQPEIAVTSIPGSCIRFILFYNH